MEKFSSIGAAAFDPLYLLNGIVDEGERCLVTLMPTETRPATAAATFSGSTEFFFLAAALLRVSLFPGLRAQQELMRRHAAIFSQMREAAKRPQASPYYSEQTKASTDAKLGWSVFLENPAFVKMATKFSMLQLQWLIGVANSTLADTGFVLSVVPEWFCKLPAEWIAFVATRTSSLLTLAEGEAAVEFATRLLQLGTCKNFRQFSPPVITELIRIPGAFVRAGTDRARTREHIARLRKKPRRRNADPIDIDEDVIDDRELDIYSSFDRNDLGVTAFTNQFVLKHLGSTLVLTFSALDAVEGADVEREHAFDKVSS